MIPERLMNNNLAERIRKKLEDETNPVARRIREARLARKERDRETAIRAAKLAR